MPAPARAKIFTPTLRLFLFAMILANLGGSMFWPFLGIYLRKLGHDVEAIGLFFTVSAIFPLVFQIFGGWVSDRIGRLRSIALGSIAGAVSWVGLIAAPATPWPLACFLVSNAVGSITVALVAPSFDAFVAEQSTKETRARVFGLVHAIYMIVGILGPPLGGLVAEKISYGTLTLISAILYWAATLVRVGMVRLATGAGSASGQGKAGGFLASLGSVWALVAAGGLFAWILVVDGALDISSKLSGDLLPLFLREVGSIEESRIGILQSVSAVCTASALVFMGGVADRRGERFPIALGCCLTALASMVLWLGGSYVAYVAAFAIFGLSLACIQPAMQSLVSKAVPERLRGMAYGFLGSSLGLFSFFAPALGGFLWKRFFPALPFVASGLLVLTMAVPVWFRFRPRSQAD